MTLVKTSLDDLTYQVNGFAFKTLNELKPGHRERVYQWRLADLLIEAGLHVDIEQRVEVYVANSLVGYMYLDLWIEQSLVVACKAFSHFITNDEIQQAIAYMTATGSPVGMIYNFGRSRTLDLQRVLPPQRVKDWHHYLYRSIVVPPGHSLPPAESVDPATIRFAVIKPARIEVGVPAIRSSALPSVEEKSSAVIRSSASVSAEEKTSAPIRSSAAPQASVEGTLSAYADSGVDIDAGNRAVELMRDAVKSTYGPEVLAGIGSFGGLFDAAALKSMNDPVLVASTDGVGTKVKLAAQCGRYESIGHDIVNHCLDDILVQGARPLFFLDYIASSKLDPEMIASIVTGMAAACRESNCALLGGETAEMPGVYQPNEFDVAGTIVGVVERSRILPRTADLQVGDVLIGLRSSGPHTNGYSLIRKIFQDIALDTYFDELNARPADTLLVPHRSYLPLLLATNSQLPTTIKALAHLTGGGFIDNIPRVLPDHLNAQIDLGSWPVLPIFNLIQRQGAVDPLEMYRVFNMGIGMIAIVAPEDVAAVQAAIPEETYRIGRLIPGGKKIVLA
jgi:phosphoribosylformylglycinamidine cyclo-ligase/phosphoribosylamine--glycine ligase/phosphoribosylformylglycinamidine cyclo-ligase